MLQISSLLAIELCNLAVDSTDAGRLAVYNGSIPPDVDTPISTQLELVSFPLKNPAFQNPVAVAGGAVADIVPPDPTVATASGSATFFRIFDSTGAARMQGTITGTGGDGDLRLPTTSIVQGVSISIIDFKITMSQ